MKTINRLCASMLLLMATAARAADHGNAVIHDKEGNFNGQVESAPDGSKKSFSTAMGILRIKPPTSGTFDAHGNRVGSVFHLQRMSDCRKAG